MTSLIICLFVQLLIIVVNSIIYKFAPRPVEVSNSLLNKTNQVENENLHWYDKITLRHIISGVTIIGVIAFVAVVGSKFM